MKNLDFFALVVGLLLVGLSACTTGQLQPSPGAGQTPAAETPNPPIETPIAPAETAGAGNPLANMPWRLVSFTEAGAETPVLPGTQVTLEFNENGQAAGSGGCNTYGASYQVLGSQLSLGQVITTERACVDAGMMEQEQRFYQALQSAAEFELSGDGLKIRYDQGVLNFVMNNPAPVRGTPTPAAPG